MTASTERAILAGGCFWGVQDLLRRYPGVVSTRVGYSGGDVPNATYRNHGTHAEAIEVIFDPKVMSYRKLLEFFFQIHDPTTLNRQGNDRGLSYRSAIFYTTDEQKEIAEDTIADVNASGLWPGKVTTEVAPAGDFWEAEPEHQDYLQDYPQGYTCHYIRPDWKLPVRATASRDGNITTMSMSDADLADDQANFVMTEWEEGARPDKVTAEAEYPCGCKAVRLSTVAGWQWVDAPDCGDDAHK